MARHWPNLAVRWTPADNLHLTLRFLGDTDPARVGDLCRGMDGVCAEAPAFELQLAGLGAFPSVDRPRVLWAGVGGSGVPALHRLQKAMEGVMCELGWPSERGKAFHPHLTLGRVRELGKARPRAGWDTESVPEQSFAVEELVLVRSELSPQGARYAIWHRASLVCNPSS